MMCCSHLRIWKHKKSIGIGCCGSQSVFGFKMAIKNHAFLGNGRFSVAWYPNLPKCLNAVFNHDSSHWRSHGIHNNSGQMMSAKRMLEFDKFYRLRRNRTKKNRPDQTKLHHNLPHNF